MNYRPALPFTATLTVLTPTSEFIAGVWQDVIPPLSSGFEIKCSFRSFGGTEQTVDGVYSIIDTAEIETWYRPDIVSGMVVATPDGALYEILGTPEDVACRHQFLKFKIRRTKGRKWSNDQTEA